MELGDNATWGDLLTLLLVKLEEPVAEIVTGFPIKRIVPLRHEQLLSELGIRPGDTLTVTTGSDNGLLKEAADSTVGQGELEMILREMPDDNSCLFSAISYVFHHTREKSTELRELSANLILSDPTSYTEAVLGMPPIKYCQWISDKDRWGGGIELAVLSKHYNSEVASIDVATGRVDIFGEGEGYQKRAYLLYSGIHYDALAMTTGPSASEEQDLTIFSPNDDTALMQAMQVAELARIEHRYTDLARFTLRCEDCGEALKGEREAEQHAIKTGHANFAEYN